MIGDLDFMYRICRNPPVLMHRVECSCAQRLDWAIEGMLRLLPGDEPAGDRLRQHLKRARWEALAEMRRPNVWYEEHAQILDDLQQSASLFGIVEELDELRSAAAAFAGLNESPLMSALRSLMTDICWTPRPDMGPTGVVPYGSATGVTARRVERLKQGLKAAGLEACTAISVHDLRRTRPHLRNAVFLASPGAFGQSVITCPAAQQSFFIFYGFMTRTGEDAEWGHALRAMVPEGVTLPIPHWACFSRFSHEHDCPSRTPEAEHHVADDTEVFAVPAVRELISRAWSDEEAQAEAEECALVDLAGGLWAGIVGRARKLSQRAGQWEHHDIEPDELEPGDLILLLVREPTDHADRTEAALQQTHAEGLELWRTIQALGRDQIAAHGWSTLREELVGQRIGAPYEYWFTEGRLGPESVDTFRMLCYAMGLNDDECEQAWSAMRAWQSYRIQYGAKLVDRFVAQALNELQDEGEPRDLPQVVHLGDPAAGSYALVYVESVASRADLPSSKTRRVLTPQGRPWCDLDRLD